MEAPSSGVSCAEQCIREHPAARRIGYGRSRSAAIWTRRGHRSAVTGTRQTSALPSNIEMGSALALDEERRPSSRAVGRESTRPMHVLQVWLPGALTLWVSTTKIANRPRLDDDTPKRRGSVHSADPRAVAHPAVGRGRIGDPRSGLGLFYRWQPRDGKQFQSAPAFAHVSTSRCSNALPRPGRSTRGNLLRGVTSPPLKNRRCNSGGRSGHAAILRAGAPPLVRRVHTWVTIGLVAHRARAGGQPRDMGSWRSWSRRRESRPSHRYIGRTRCPISTISRLLLLERSARAGTTPDSGIATGRRCVWRCGADRRRRPSPKLASRHPAGRVRAGFNSGPRHGWFPLR